jgi:hypothetical protein
MIKKLLDVVLRPGGLIVNGQQTSFNFDVPHIKSKISLLLFLFLISSTTKAQVTIDASHFNWSKIEDATPISVVYTDADNGDGLNDGAMVLKSAANTPASQGLQYLLAGTPADGEVINLETKYYQIGTSYVGFKMQVYDVTSSAVLGQSASVATASGVVGTLTFSYTFASSSVGHQIAIRLLRTDDLNPVRQAGIDYLKIDGQFASMQAPPIAFDVSDFSWTKIEDASQVALVYNDADNGDGLNDGAVLLKEAASTPAIQGLQYLLGGTPFANGQINLEAKYYQTAASYCKFKMQVFDVTDNVVLAEAPAVTTSAGVVGTTTLTYVFTASSAGDQIMVRFVRADDLNPVRQAAIDYVKVNGQFVNMTYICKPTYNFDLPLTTATTSELSDLAAIRSSLSDQILGTTAPTTSQMNSAIAQYNALNLTITGTKITGAAITDDSQISFLKTFARYLKFNPTDTSIISKAVNTVWYASGQNCSPSSNSALTFYNYPTLSRAAVFLNNYLPDNVKNLFGNTLMTETNSFQYLFDANYDFNTTQSNGAVLTDTYYLDMDVLLAYSDWFKTNDEKVRWLKTAKRFLDRGLIYTYGTKDGLKIDGLGYHHNNNYDGYMYAYGTIATCLKSLEGTGFQIDQPSYLRFRDAVYAQTMYSNDAGTKPFAMAGRNPQTKTTTLSSGTLANLAITGGKILGLGTADPILAGSYNRRYGVNSNFNYSIASPFEEGYIQFNYGNLGVYRKNNWIASFKGQSNVLWGSEIYINQNRYGRYEGYGALDITYPGNVATGNGFSDIGWDWNYNPGTTTIVLPWDKLQAEKERVDEYNTYGFAGALTLDQAHKDVLSNTIGQSGLFSMKFKERTDLGFGAVYGPTTHNGTFEFTKTYFAIDNYIICLASGIKNNDAGDSTVTTLFQRLNNNSADVVVNGDVKTNESAASFSGSAANWIIDNYSTGFYIAPNSGTLKIRNSLQTTPYQNQVSPSAATIAGNSGNNYRVAYLDHGSAPVNSSYEFVCMPSASTTTMSAFAQQMQSDSSKPYIVHQNNTSQQIIEHKASGTWAYALPAANASINDGLVIANDQPCLAMYKSVNQSPAQILLSVSNPDLGTAPSTPKSITLTLKGKWKLSQTNINAAIVSATAAATTIQFTTSDGLPVEVTLQAPAPPTVSISSPASSTSFNAPANISINANAAVAEGNIVKVEFFQGASKLGEDSTAPYSLVWNNVAAGTYSITAKASDDNGLVTVSDSVNVSVNALPEVAIASPASDTSVNANTTITITANAADADGSIAKVEFFQGANKLGEDTTAPYSFDWANVTAGNYTISAKATDNSGAVTTSDSVNIHVNALPVVAVTSPANNTSVNAPATVTISATASDSDGSIVEVEFFEGTNKLGEDTTAPYSFDWTNVAAGNYSITAKATDNSGAVTISGIVNINVNALPLVAITSPASNTTVDAPGTVTISANASDADGSIVKVEFFQGGNKLGESTTAPYRFQWTNIPTGSYALTTKATDNNGAVAITDTVRVNIVCPAVQINIPDVYALSSQLDIKNTIYLGYGPSSLTLTASAQGSSGYTYNWNTGAQTQSISVSQAGVYTATVTYAGTCQSTASVTMNLLDVRCGDNSKVMVCHNNKTICVASDAVQAHLNHGDFLGSCDQKNNSSQIQSVGLTPDERFSIYPNPVKDQLNISLSSLDSKAMAQVFSSTGQLVRSCQLLQKRQAISLDGLPNGTYFLVVKNGTEVFRKTIVKQ